MKLGLILIAVAAGFVSALHLSMGASVGKQVMNTRMSNMVFWIVGMAAAVTIGLTRLEVKDFLLRAQNVPLWQWTAGAMGACLVFAIIWLIPQLGAGTVMIMLLMGQVIGGVIFSHFGWLGSAVETINWIKVVGIVVMIGGAALAVLGKLPFIR